MCWKLMKCGHLFTKDGTNAGFGQSCVVEHAKSWPWSSGIVAKQPAVNFGNKFHQPIKLAKATAIFGKRINSSFLKKHMSALARAAGRQTTWSVGITPYGNQVRGSLEKLYPFQNPTQCTKLLQDFLSFGTTSHLFLNHYLIKNVDPTRLSIPVDIQVS